MTKMERSYFFYVEIEDEELEQILKELHEATETIRKCYQRLEELETVKKIKKSPAHTDDFSN